MTFVIFFNYRRIHFRWRAAAVQKKNFGARTHAFARTQHHPPIVDGVFLREQDFNLSAASRFGSVESGGDDSRIIQDQNLAGTQVLRNVAKDRKSTRLNSSH